MKDENPGLEEGGGGFLGLGKRKGCIRREVLLRRQSSTVSIAEVNVLTVSFEAHNEGKK